MITTLLYIITFSRLFWAAGFAIVVWNLWPIEKLTLPVFGVLAGLGVLTELSDLIDGIIARKTHRCSELGGILDPLCDSISRLTLYFTLGFAGWVLLAVPLIMAFRDIVVAYTRIIQARLGGKTSARMSGKAKAVIQCGGIFALLILAMFNSPAAVIMRYVVEVLVITVTLWSMTDYLRSAWPGVLALAKKKTN